MAIRTLNFEDIAKGATAEERDALAWHLAQIRARKTYNDLREPFCEECQGPCLRRPRHGEIGR